MAKKPVRNLIVVSDTHCGCRLGLCPPGPIPLDDGGSYSPSKFQQQMWRLWREFWDVWVPEVTKKESWDFVLNGDAIEGTHHRATTPISHNIAVDQMRIALMTLRPIVDMCHASGGRYWHIRGTEAHSGTSAAYEENLAKQLGAVPNEFGQYSRYELYKRVGTSKGPLVHLLHHIGTTGSAAYESSAPMSELAASYVEAARWGREPPDYVVRSHRHRSIAVDIDSEKGYAAAIVTPAWQGKGPFPFKVPGARLAEPQFGGILIRQGDQEHYYRRRVFTFDRAPEE